MRFSMFLKHFIVLHLFLLSQSILLAQDGFHGEERDAILALVSGFNSSFLHHNWTSIMCYLNDPPRWLGIQCTNGRVTGVRLENLGLQGEIKSDVLFNLTQLSILSLKNNSISGNLMDFSKNPKLTEIDLSGNRFSGEIPLSLVTLNSLASLQLQDNNLSGSIPSFDQTSLKRFNVSYNNLSGPIPSTRAFQSLDPSSFLGDQYLCGSPSSAACNSKSVTPDTNGDNHSTNSKHHNTFSKSIFLLLGLLAVSLFVLLVILYLFIRKYKMCKKRQHQSHISIHADVPEDFDEKTNAESRKKWAGAGEGKNRGKLEFLDGEGEFELGQLLKASAEGLGKGNFGNCYRAIIQNGPTVVVKRLKDLKPLSNEEFIKHVGIIGEQNHPNLLPLLAYFCSKGEKLLIYKFASNGNVYNRLHEGKGKPSRIPFGWSSRLSVARGVARALEHLHLNTKSSNVVPHGNLKSSNVLLDENDAVLVADYGLTSLVSAPLAAQRMMSYKSPEYQTSKQVSRKSDVWSYGCLLLELVTGRASGDTARPGTNGVDLCSWVHRAVREVWTAEVFDLEIAVQRSASSGMVKLLQIAMRCCEQSPDNRPEMIEVVREVESIAVAADSEDDEEFSSVDPSLTVTDESLVIVATPSQFVP